MASTKAVTILDNNVTLVAAAANHTSGLFTRLSDYAAGLLIKVTNGTTGPTLAAQAQIQVSMDNSNWFKLGGTLIATLGNNGVTSWVVNLPIWAKYAQVISGSNTGQNVVIRVEGGDLTAIS